VEQASPSQHIALARVLVATDFSSASQAALLYALSIARRYDATLYLAHVVRPDTFRRESDASPAATDEAWREGQRLTTDLLVSGQLRGIPHKLLVAQGEIWDGLAPLLQENQIDLLVVGTRGRSGLAKMLLGSVAESIFRQASCPVLTVGPNSVGPTPQEGGLHCILYATDFTPQSLHALDHAVSLAQHYQSQLTLLHVVPETSENGLDHDRRIEQARTQLRRLLPSGTSLQPEPEFVVSLGTPAARILEAAADKTPDLIVLGVTHPQSSTLAGRRWTVAAEVAATAPCPVLTVRADRN